MRQSKIQRTVAEQNRAKYLHAPPYKMIEKYVKGYLKLKSMKQFEKFFGIPSGTLILVNMGLRELPAKFWHIVYEKLRPNYGVGFFNPETFQLEYTTPKKKKEVKPKPVIVNKQQEAVNTLLLDKLKEQLQ